MKSRWALGGGAVTVCTVLLAVYLGTTSPWGGAVAAGVLYTGVTAGLALYLAFRNGRRDLFSPAVLFLSYSAFGVGVRGIINLVTKTSRIQNAIDPTSVNFATLSTRVFLYGLLGTVAFAVGERLARRRRAPASPACAGPPLPVARVRWVLASAMAVTVGAVAFLVWRLGAVVFLNPSYAVVRGGFGLFWVYPLLYSAIFAWSLGIADRWTRGMRPSWWQFLGLAGSALTVYAVTSAKAALANAVIIPVVLYHYTVRPVRWRYIFIPVLVFILVLPALYLYREVGANAQLLQHLTVKQMLTGGQILLGRSYLADSFAAVLAYTPRVYGFQYGRPWLELFYFWIPRAFWPSKPVTYSIAFGQTYLSAYREGTLSFMSPTLLGDAYMNFGALGILVVFLAVGYGLRRWYDATIGSRPRPELLLLYAATAYWIVIWPEQSVAIMVEMVVSYVAPAILVAAAARGLGSSSRTHADLVQHR